MSSIMSMLRQFEYLVALSEHGNFRRAADAVHISQPTLSQQLRTLEAKLGAQLVEGLVAGDVYKQLLEKGLIVNAVNATTLRLAPPLTVSDAEIDEAVALIAEVLS